MATEVTSDGRTVWVHIDGICRARLCKISAEYTDEGGCPVDLDAFPSWEVFVRKCSDLLGVDAEEFEGHLRAFLGELFSG